MWGLYRLFDKLLWALVGLMSCNFWLEMEWLMFRGPLYKHISGGYSLGVLLHLTWYNRSSLFLCFFCIVFLLCFIFEFGDLSFFFLFESCFLVYIHSSFGFLYFFSFPIWTFWDLGVSVGKLRFKNKGRKFEIERKMKNKLKNPKMIFVLFLGNICAISDWLCSLVL